MAEIARKTKRYPTDLTDEEWDRIQPLLPKAPRRGRKPAVDPREILNAIRYMARSGGGWRMLPTNFGPWQTVYWWFRRFVRLLLFRTIHDVALMIDRERAGREASPSAAVIDRWGVAATRHRLTGRRQDGYRGIERAIDAQGGSNMARYVGLDVSVRQGRFHAPGLDADHRKASLR